FERISGFGRVVGNVEIEHARWTPEVEEVLERIAAGVVRQFIDEGLNSKGVVVARHRPQPAETNMGFGGTILDSKVRDIVRRLDPISLELPSAMMRGGVESGVDRRKG